MLNQTYYSKGKDLSLSTCVYQRDMLIQVICTIVWNWGIETRFAGRVSVVFLILVMSKGNFIRDRTITWYINQI